MPANFPLGIMHYPVPDGGKCPNCKTLSVAGSYVIYSKSRNKDCAGAMLKSMATRQNGTKWMEMVSLQTGLRAEPEKIKSSRADYFAELTARNTNVSYFFGTPLFHYRAKVRGNVHTGHEQCVSGCAHRRAGCSREDGCRLPEALTWPLGRASRSSMRPGGATPSGSLSDPRRDELAGTRYLRGTGNHYLYRTYRVSRLPHVLRQFLHHRGAGRTPSSVSPTIASCSPTRHSGSQRATPSFGHSWLRFWMWRPACCLRSRSMQGFRSRDFCASPGSRPCCCPTSSSRSSGCGSTTTTGAS